MSVYSPSRGGTILKSIGSANVRFQCQQSGHCCCDPGILVTLTFFDVYRLYQLLENDFEYMIKKLTFFKVDNSFDESMRKKLVLEAIQTKEGNIVPGLRKIAGKNCTFYKQPNCIIYSSRPRACRNYPFAFSRKKEHIEVLLAKDANKNCIGIGKGPSLPISGLYKQGRETLGEIDLHNEFIKELNIEASKGNPLSAREAIWMFIVYGEKLASTQG